MGGMNNVQPEKTLQKAALEQYLAGGFSVDSIITQASNCCKQLAVMVF